MSVCLLVCLAVNQVSVHLLIGLVGIVDLITSPFRLSVYALQRQWLLLLLYCCIVVVVIVVRASEDLSVGS